MSNLTEKEALKDLESNLRFPPFQIKVRNDKDFGSMPTSQRPDAILNIKYEPVGSYDFAVEYKSTGGMANLRVAILTAQANAYANKGLLPLVLMPFLREEALDELVRQQVSGLDLSGNGVLYVPGVWFGYRTGGKNQFPSTLPKSSPYRGEQSIVGRALLTQNEFATQSALVQYLTEFTVTNSTVSKVLSAMAEDLIVRKKPRITLERPDVLLDRLTENYRPPKTRKVQRIRFDLTDDVKAKMAANMWDTKVRYAIESPDQYTVAPSSGTMLQILTNDWERLMKDIPYQSDERFANVELTEIDARFPFFGRELINGLWYTSPLQAYLTLSLGGKRERQIAETLRASLLTSARA